mgnify:CR=1 FL=1
MKRLDFIKSFGLGGTSLILPNLNLGKKPIKIYDNYLKGIIHYQLNEVIKKINIGEELKLSREVDNIYDSFAIGVFYEDTKLGYIAAFENIVLANLLDQGVELTSFISNLNKEDNYRAVSIEIYANIIVQNPKIIPTNLLEKRADDAKDSYRTGIIK